MVSLVNPIAPTMARAIGIDAEIQRLQLLLAQRLTWLQVSYGKAYRGSRREGGKALYYPEVYDGAGEYRDVLPNDNVAAQSFFYPRDPASTGAQEPGGPLPLAQTVDYIFWGSLQRIDPTKDYRYETELLRDVVEVLSNNGALVQRVYTSPEEVYRGFSVDTVGEQCLRQPFAGFRVQLELSVSNLLCMPDLFVEEPDQLALRSGGFVALRSGGLLQLRG